MSRFEYKCVRICETAQQTEEMLCKLGADGWKVVTSYAQNNYWLILQRIVIKD